MFTLLLAGMPLGTAPLYGQTVDLHTHIILPEYLEVLKAHGAELEESFPLPAWDAARHIDFMDCAGIRTAVLTMPAPQPYYGDTDESARCIRRVNEASAELKQRYPGRFRFCAALPLPDVEAAIREAVYALDTLGADGVKLATNSRGQYVGDEALDPLMEVLNERHAVVILHPHRPTPCPKENYRHHTAGHVRISGRIDPDRGEHAGAERAGPLPEYEGGRAPLRFVPSAGIAENEIHPPGDGVAGLHAAD